jgi:hypothetical protein
MGLTTLDDFLTALAHQPEVVRTTKPHCCYVLALVSPSLWDLAATIRVTSTGYA